MAQRSETFMERLKQIEESKDVSPLVELFEPSAQCENMANENGKARAVDPAQFWEQYLHAFEDVHSTFTHAYENENSAVLEWESEGRLPSGAPIHYRGVSILDFDQDQSKIRGFRTYYDSAAFVQSPSRNT